MLFVVNPYDVSANSICLSAITLLSSVVCHTTQYFGFSPSLIPVDKQLLIKGFISIIVLNFN
ncbi:hypothetical protein VCHA43P277_10398 [Vibrio chagasii]|nr:hypothetical protein VCHA42P256_120065 [Vibrio chagasii]CAH6926339.1 hypothetical protein VCHA43P272_130090 [Vibrio chagasii]CAH7028346.1 hypothetical protein VCHA34P126_60066 [Vibrio chagasii]CAH7070097.1 hypothetical protein VCHA43P277_10398 [Vibrio chagasii]CAH7141221.1 hypothetical protein VCHA50P416_120092 [Vibrio chagasii]